MQLHILIPPAVTGVLLIVTAILADKASEKHKPWYWAAFVALVVIAGALDVSEKSDSHNEAEKLQGQVTGLNSQVKGLNSRVDSLNNALQKSETQRQVDTAVLSTKLSDYAQFGPAVMKLATVSEEYQKRQYEQKVATDKDLYESTMHLVEKVRALGSKYMQAQQAVQSSFFNQERPASEDARNRAWNEMTSKEMQLSTNERNEFQALAPDILYIHNQLLARKLPEPKLSLIDQTITQSFFQYGFATTSGENAIATYLEIMVKPLSSQK